MKTLTLPRLSLLGVLAGAIALLVLASAALIARADSAPSITSTIQNGSNANITSAPIGTDVHNSVTVASSTSSTTPTGTVDFNLYSNTSCSGTPAVQSGVALTNGSAQSSTTTVPVGGLSYLVHYSGDASTTAANSACQALTATASNVSISTALSTTSVLAGSTVYDTSVLNNETANATGTVTYTVYDNNLCTTGARAAGVKTVTNGNVPNSDVLQFNNTGTFFWQAVYSGDQNNSSATSVCQNGILTVAATSSTPTTTPPVPPTGGPGTISGTVYNDQNNNDKKDANDPRLSGWSVWLHKAATTTTKYGKKVDLYDAPIVATATTDANGNYTFDNLAAGTYFLEEQEKTGWNQTSDDTKVVLTASTTSATVDFANVMKGQNNNNNGHDNDNDDDDNNGNGHGNNDNHWGWFKNFWGHFWHR